MLIKQVHQINLIFITISFKYEPYLCNGCHNLMQKAISFIDIAIVYVKGSAYRAHYNNYNLVDKKSIFFSKFFFFINVQEMNESIKKLIIKRTKKLS